MLFTMLGYNWPHISTLSHEICGVEGVTLDRSELHPSGSWVVAPL